MKDKFLNKNKTSFNLNVLFKISIRLMLKLIPDFLIRLNFKS
ncbi:hypothetical protein LEP1GSC115_1979 [Leptospira interrogans serovar Australis str. 200703203]|uniref:Uncharacterized protein n=1 Tax=Leptospira interrogans serovar Australis str. 200703203 TaxID=1085541 RepID=N1UHR4_LEPIR|nr:hypothetical protein LEP1GSC115_1979 [Leptospira interrogans serovar Australis str. 200703203]